MDFEYSPRVQEMRQRLIAFMDQHIYPGEPAYYAHTRSDKRWEPVPVIEKLKPLARKAGLWNLFLPHSKRAPEGLSNLEYAPLCEIMGRTSWSPEVFNCSAPDTGNMETIERYGSEEQKKQWLEPLLRGEIRSAFLMTEPAVASSDATNIQMQIKRDGNDYVINGRKWWSSGAGDSRCKVYIVMGKTNPDAASRHSQQSMILVAVGTPGIKILHHLNVFGYDDAPHGHMDKTGPSTVNHLVSFLRTVKWSPLPCFTEPKTVLRSSLMTCCWSAVTLAIPPDEYTTISASPASLRIYVFAINWFGFRLLNATWPPTI